MEIDRISFVTDGDAADERLIREYVVPALDRIEAVDGCAGARFSRFGMDPRYDRSEVRLGIYGAPDAVVDAERDRWDELVASGLARSWSREGPPFADLSREVQEFLGEAYVLGSAMAGEYYDRFEERPALVEEATTEGGHRYGLWSSIHVFANNVGYTPEEEVDAYELLLRDRLTAITQLRDYDTVRERIDDLRETLDELEGTVDDLEAGGGFEYYDGPE